MVARASEYVLFVCLLRDLRAIVLISILRDRRGLRLSQGRGNIVPHANVNQMVI